CFVRYLYPWIHLHTDSLPSLSSAHFFQRPNAPCSFQCSSPGRSSIWIGSAPYSVLPHFSNGTAVRFIRSLLPFCLPFFCAPRFVLTQEAAEPFYKAHCGGSLPSVLRFSTSVWIRCFPQE